MSLLSTITGRWRLLDPYILLVMILLVLIGLAAIYSVTINIESPDYGKVVRQLVFAMVGLAVFFFTSFFDYRFFKTAAWFAYVLGLILLVSVLLFGAEIRGATGWFAVGNLTFQPVELAKILLLIFLARFFSDHIDSPNHWRMIIITGLMTALYIGLIILQPDLGSALLLFFIWLGMILFTKIKKKHLLFIAVGLILVALISWNFVLYDYQRERVETFLNPSLDPLGQGYNVSQSIVAIGSGGVFGRGLGLGTQSQLNFLPEAEEDFIFAVIAEELGFVGILLLLTLFTLLFWRLLKALRKSRDNFSFYVILGVILMIYVQMIVNISTNIGLMPVAGIPLPLISAGGSSLLTTLMALGLVESVIIHNNRSLA
jgi:rod shape determining protein RodA